jgi:hypothetical protein
VAITLTATLTGSFGTPSGTVTFNDNGTPIAGCASVFLSTSSAQCTTSSLVTGTHSITVTYAGDVTYTPGTSNPFIQTVNIAALAKIFIGSTRNPSTSGQAITWTATLTGSAATPSGTVTFNDSGTPISGCISVPLSTGAAQCTPAALAIGAHPITVTYSGDATYRASTSGTFTQTVNAAVAIFSIASDHNPSTPGQIVILTASLTGSAGTPTGTVTFNDSGTPISGCSSLPLSAGIAQCATAFGAAGAHPITVAYSGDPVYRAGTSSTFTQNVTAALAGIFIASTRNPSTSGQAVTLTTTLTGSAGTPTGTVTFNDNGTPIPECTSLPLSVGVAQCTTSSLAAGAHPVTVTYSGDMAYRTSTSGTFTQTVN